MNSTPTSVGVSSRYPLRDALYELGIKPCDTATVLAYRERFIRKKFGEFNTSSLEMIRMAAFVLHVGIFALIGWGIFGLGGVVLGLLPIIWMTLVKYLQPDGTRLITITHFIVTGLWVSIVVERISSGEIRFVVHIPLPGHHRASPKHPLYQHIGRIQEKCPDAQFSNDTYVLNGENISIFLVVRLGVETYYIHDTDQFE